MSSSKSASSTAVGLRRVGDNLLGVEWADGTESVLPLREIRIACGCAVCCNELTGEPLLDPASVSKDIRASSITPVGNYALTFDWSDGHTTGIYPWEQLRALGDRLSATSLPTTDNW